MKAQQTTLTGWGRSSHEACQLYRPESWTQARAALHVTESTCIARGLGRAYGDAALNRDQAVIECTKLNRFLKFDDTTGVLECEAGTSLAEIIATFLPRGWALPTTPGTKFVTIGGAIAADVHGKNHHHGGSFGEYVNRLQLLTADGQIRDLCRTSGEAGQVARLSVFNPDGAAPSRDGASLNNAGANGTQSLFTATLGGMGLTGVILSAEVRLKRVESGYVDCVYRRTRDLDETLDVFGREDGNFEHSVAWIDCLASGRSLGRSVVMLANDCPVSNLPPSLRDTPFKQPNKRLKSVPIELPNFVLNPLSVRAFNECYYWAHGNRSCQVDYNTFFYPLDGVQHWNRIYGRRGFAQYQALFPPETSRRGLIELLQEITRSKLGSFLAVLKSSGPAGAGPLSFLHPGHTLALDFPLSARMSELFHKLDEIVLKYGGRLYLAKDSQTSSDALHAMYPRLSELQKLKAQIDPAGRFASSQARRLGLLPQVAAVDISERKAA